MRHIEGGGSCDDDALHSPFFVRTATTFTLLVSTVSCSPSSGPT